ncbi:MAG: hypothetical protein LBG80_09420 [Bacteroidales bacterium]|jgi:hypothetical protein|nr:hypothetical protein [Bacteroidales bacterium]
METIPTKALETAIDAYSALIKSRVAEMELRNEELLRKLAEAQRIIKEQEDRLKKLQAQFAEKTAQAEQSKRPARLL